jgi:hypothetical protein
MIISLYIIILVFVKLNIINVESYYTIWYVLYRFVDIRNTYNRITFITINVFWIRKLHDLDHIDYDTIFRECLWYLIVFLSVVLSRKHYCKVFFIKEGFLLPYVCFIFPARVREWKWNISILDINSISLKLYFWYLRVFSLPILKEHE